jgi:anti-sigma regulatory factor (Ser/Thr protein kinase)
LKDRNVFREKSSISSWLSGKRWKMPSCTVIRKIQKTKVHIRCRCQPGKEISIVVTDQGKGFDFEKIVGRGVMSDPAAEHGRGIQLMKAYMDDVHFERRGSEVHLRKRSRASFPS